MATIDTSEEVRGSAPTGSPPRDDLFRAIQPGVSLRDSDTEARPVMYGHFSKFGEYAEIDSLYEGHFLERVMPGAFAKTIAENRQNMKVMFHHGHDQLGLQVLGTIEVLREDSEGAYYEVSLFPGIPQLIMDGLRAGEYGSSHRFTVVREDFVQRPRRSQHNPNGIPERSILEAKVREFGPTPFAAFAGATSNVRSLTDDMLIGKLAQQDPERFGQLVTRSGISVPASIQLDGREIAATAERAAVRANREYKRAIDLVGETPWAIHPTALATILGIVGERANGHRPSEAEIRERIGTRTAPDQPTESTVAVLPLHGPITPRADMFTETSGLSSVQGFQEQFRAALADGNVAAIMLDIDSPGGTADLVPELATEIMAARGTKPIVAQVNTMAASAAYWIACACDEIVVTPSGDVGSIGVYSSHTDMSAAMAKAGVKTTLVSAGDYKVERNPFEPLNDAAKAEMQQRVDAIYVDFVQAVADGRNVSTETVLSDFGQGRLVMSARAVEIGMADSVATYDQTLARLQAEHQAQVSEPEPSEATTQPEAITGPERPVATTRRESKYNLRPQKEVSSWRL